MTGSVLLDIVLSISVAMMLATVAMISYRLVRGPHAADRVVALDMLGVVGVGLAAAASLVAGHSAFFDIGLGRGLFGFLGSVAFAIFIERISSRAGADR